MSNRSNTGRSEDIIALYKELERESDPQRRLNIERSIRVIKNETGAIRSMRESLIRAHRSGNMEEVKDIHDYIRTKANYKNEI